MTFIERVLRLLYRMGRGTAVACGTALKVITRPIGALILWGMRKGNRVLQRLVHALRRFSYIKARYGLKRALRLTAYRLEQMLIPRREQLQTGFRRLVPMALAVVLLVGVMQVWNVYTLAYAVTYDGSCLGYVSSEEVFRDACTMVDDRVVNDRFTAKPVDYSLTVVSADQVQDADAICESLIRVSDEIRTAVGLYIDGQPVAVCEDGESIKSAMDQMVAAYPHPNQDETISFANKIEYISGLYPAESIGDSVDLKQLSKALTVMITGRTTYTKSIPYKTETRTDPSCYVGYRGTKVKGIKGKKQVVADVSYINGKEVSRTIVSETVLSEPKTQIEVVGTKQYSRANNTDTGTRMFWPVADTNVNNVSAYFGDGRNHQGIDICAPKGTPIYAAEDGVVTFVGWQSGYGNYVTVSHGGGICTRYAHCSSISAVVGQKVKRGDCIAAVGITGRASAYHCHFEVRVNDRAVDARPYLGLK